MQYSERKSINELYGIILGINADEVINSEEVSFLQEWLTNNKNYENTDLLKDIYKILKEVLEDDVITPTEKEQLLQMCKTIESQFLNEKDCFSNLLGIIQGISCDKKINDSELIRLNKWLEENYILQGNLIFDKVYATVKQVLDDGVISSQEEKELLNLFNTIIISKKEYMTINYIRSINKTKKKYWK